MLMDERRGRRQERRGRRPAASCGGGLGPARGEHGMKETVYRMLARQCEILFDPFVIHTNSKNIGQCGGAGCLPPVSHHVEQQGAAAGVASDHRLCFHRSD
jgi:hypothetical protein